MASAQVKVEVDQIAEVETTATVNDHAEGSKRKREDTQASHADDAVKEEDNETKRQRVVDAADAAPSSNEVGDQEAATGGKRKRANVKLGYAVFDGVKSAKEFFKALLASWPRNVDMNEYEYVALLDLLRHHPKADSKLGCGVKAFQVRQYTVSTQHQNKKPLTPRKDDNSAAFYVLRKDGSLEDFSYLKCLQSIFPGEISMLQHTQPYRGPGGRKGGAGEAQGE